MCFSFSVFPSDCRSYFGPHSVACLKALWAESDCSEKGHSWPDNLNASRKSALDVLNLKYILAGLMLRYAISIKNYTFLLQTS